MLAKKYQSQPLAIASYDWTDLASGKSYKTFYGGKAEGNYFFTTQAINSGNASYGTIDITTLSSKFDNETGVHKAISINFDTTFDVPMTIKGDCIINATTGIVSEDSGDPNGKLVVQMLKNGVHIISGSTAFLAYVGTSDVNLPHSREHVLIFDVPETFFAIGDTLRFTVEAWAQMVTGSKHAYQGLAHDAGDRNDSNVAIKKTIEDDHSTKLTFAVPFKVDV